MEGASPVRRLVVMQAKDVESFNLVVKEVMVRERANGRKVWVREPDGW